MLVDADPSFVSTLQADRLALRKLPLTLAFMSRPDRPATKRPLRRPDTTSDPVARDTPF